MIEVREKSQVVAFFDGRLLICKAIQNGGAQNLRDSHATHSRMPNTIWPLPYASLFVAVIGTAEQYPATKRMPQIDGEFN